MCDSWWAKSSLGNGGDPYVCRISLGPSSAKRELYKNYQIKYMIMIDIYAWIVEMPKCSLYKRTAISIEG